LGIIRLTAGAIASAAAVAACATFLGACSGGSGEVTDRRFSAVTSDEYTEPVHNVVIGTPEGVVRGATLMPDGQIVGGTTEANSVQVSAAPAATARTPKRGGGTVASGGGVASSSGGSSSSSGVAGSSGGGSSGVSIPPPPSSSSSGSSSGGASGGGGTGSSSSGGSSSGIITSDGGFFDEAGGGENVGGFGQWHFDDCSATSNFLIDSSGEGANAQHALGAACVPGISGLGVDFRTSKDVVQVPDEPQFTVTDRIGVAAWVHPNTVTGNQPIIVKRLNNDTAFSLGVHNGNIEMSVVLASGTTVISRAPISPGVWTHVAGMYDGTFVFLFINGQQFGQVFGGGGLHNVFAPLRIGATSQTQLFDGIIDEVFVTTQDITSQTLTDLACLQAPSTVSVNATPTGPQPFETTVHYDVTVNDNDIGFCGGGKQYDFFNESFDPNFNVSFDTSTFVFATPGVPVTFGVDITSSDEADPGDHQLLFAVDAFEEAPPFSDEFLTVALDYDVAQPTGCFVASREELMITTTSVVDDPVRTAGNSPPTSFIGSGGFDGGVIFSGSSSGAAGSSGGGIGIPLPVAAPAAAFDASVPVPTEGGTTEGGTAPASSQGVWSFGHLMREMAPSPEQAPAMVLQLLQLFLSDQHINGFTVAAKPLMQQDLIDIWPKLANGDLDLDQAPVTLEAIVNRVDIRNLSSGSAGEGRFVFGVDGPAFQNFNIIIEYNLPAQTQDDVQNWANRWHALSSHPFPSEEYNAALEAITRSFTDHGMMPSGVNGSALNEFRTNEFALSGFFEWELRGFVLDPTTGFLSETTVKETPDISFNGSNAVADFINQNGPAIKAEIPGANDNTVPATFEGQNFLGGSALNPFFAWNGPGITDPDARFHMSTNTCNGCHGPDTGTPNFQMISPRFAVGQEATLSPFITGVTVFDPFSGQTRTLNDLGRRRTDLTGLVCGTDGGTTATDGGTTEADAISPPPPPPPARDASTGPAPGTM
jgi:hypothetical protein